MKLPDPRVRGVRLRRVLAAVVGLLCVAGLLPGVARADNPIVQTIYTADPAPLVYNGRVYLYTGHDEDNSTYFTMKEWRGGSSAGMVNWADHRPPPHPARLSWGGANPPAGENGHPHGKVYS